jgi:hypothetical protein
VITVYHYFIKDFFHVEGAFALPSHNERCGSVRCGSASAWQPHLVVRSLE